MEDARVREVVAAIPKGRWMSYAEWPPPAAARRRRAPSTGG